MKKRFNTTGICLPDNHYMVNMQEKVQQIIEKYVETGEYFTINRARQYGKTTTLSLLEKSLTKNYTVLSITFEGAGESAFCNETNFCSFICRLLYNAIQYGEVCKIPKNYIEKCRMMGQKNSETDLLDLSDFISDLCNALEQPLILMIDEVDYAGNQEIFLSFLGMLRAKYLNRTKRKTFLSVILAGVYDIKNLKLKIRTNQEHTYNSPWNIAADFQISMNFSAKDICTMLQDYEKDWHTEMDLPAMADTIFEYTAGYPYFVSALCKIMDEQLVCLPQFGSKSEAWKKPGILKAIKILLNTPNTLFDDMIKHLNEYPELNHMLQNILFQGQRYTYNGYNFVINLAEMFGFVVNNDGDVAISNRIFETSMYDYFLSESMMKQQNHAIRSQDKNQFLVNGMLDMDKVMECFVTYFTDLYDYKDEKFVEEYGRKLFLLYLKPIINGSGNYYVEARTRTNQRTDIIVDYMGKQFVIELKIWRGNEYHSRSEQQLADYLEQYHLQKGWMLSFCFNQKKQPGIYQVRFKDKLLVEAIV